MQQLRLSCLQTKKLEEISRLGRSCSNPRKVRAETESDLVISHKRRESPPQFTPLNITYERLLPIIRYLPEFKWPTLI